MNVPRKCMWIIGVCLFVMLATTVQLVAQNTNAAAKKPLVVTARQTYVTSPQNIDQFVTLTWAAGGFSDTNYTATCTPQSSDIQLWFFQISSVSSTSITVELAAYNTETIIIHCIAVHD